MQLRFTVLGVDRHRQPERATGGDLHYSDHDPGILVHHRRIGSEAGRSPAPAGIEPPAVIGEQCMLAGDGPVTAEDEALAGHQMLLAWQDARAFLLRHPAFASPAARPLSPDGLRATRPKSRRRL